MMFKNQTGKEKRTEKNIKTYKRIQNNTETIQNKQKTQLQPYRKIK